MWTWTLKVEITPWRFTLWMLPLSFELKERGSYTRCTFTSWVGNSSPNWSSNPKVMSHLLPGVPSWTNWWLYRVSQSLSQRRDETCKGSSFSFWYLRLFRRKRTLILIYNVDLGLYQTIFVWKLRLLSSGEYGRCLWRILFTLSI